MAQPSSRTRGLPFPAEIQRLVKAQLPFILAINEKQLPNLGLAFDESTPHRNKQGSRPSQSAFVALQIALANSLGEPFPQQSGGVDGIVQDVFPAEEQLENSDTSAGSQKPFGFHTDKSCSPDQSPDWVTLACVRNVERGATLVSLVQQIISRLATSQRQELKSRYFRFGIARLLRCGGSVRSLGSPLLVDIGTRQLPKPHVLLWRSLLRYRCEIRRRLW